MRGVGSPVGANFANSYLEILIEENYYSIGRWRFSKPDNTVLEALTEEILECFDALRIVINNATSLELDANLCNQYLVKLAEWGRTAYQAFFGEDRPNKILSNRLYENVAPTFVSEVMPFPWEVLFEGSEEDYEQGNPEMFWGLRYTPARILNPEKDIADYVSEQAQPSDMLFCLHHRLLHAHKKERPEIERLVSLSHGRFTLLGTACNLTNGQHSDPLGDDLLRYLYNASHNMLHFACHCQESKLGDKLLISFIQDEEMAENALVLELETYKFLLRQGQFLYQPLVFLNACQSAGGADELRRTFNLPKVFIQNGAAAVIATACPVPDIFAAEFAKIFYKFFLLGKVVENETTGETGAISMTIGEALQATRWYFLKKYNNPLGLAYGVYSPASYRIRIL
ncbi:MAG: CHAT domain-containing protein [Scytonema sp. PMC 1069.18]|nr:CHAT domain-containing protein [Scytonema sp. PMC 1069.18]MEC4881246.1 CHAT domain-containing protein [Scytonema sp. PMC 1070.18]